MQRALPSAAAEFPFNGSMQHNLADVHDIIGIHGGRFYVRKSEEGSIFMFTLPSVSQEQKGECADRKSA
jgi:signal transduction histidine kinase